MTATNEFAAWEQAIGEHMGVASLRWDSAVDGDLYTLTGYLNPSIEPVTDESGVWAYLRRLDDALTAACMESIELRGVSFGWEYGQPCQVVLSFWKRDAAH